MTTQSDNPSVVRRALLGVLPAVASLSGCRSGAPTHPASGPRPADGQPPGGVEASGPRQAGVDRPTQPQTHAVVSVYDLSPGADPARVAARLGEAVLELTGKPRIALGLEVEDLTVTVGAGPRLVGLARQDVAGGLELPVFAGEERTARAWGGDLLVQACASDPVAAVLADTRLSAQLTSEGASRRWSQTGFRPPGGGAVRNLLGFPDGIENPHTRADLEREVWLPEPAPLTDGTIAVVRRLRIDVPEFLAQSSARQEEVIGRRKADGAPLSGGGPADRLDLAAKSARGRYLVPAMAHARRANPNATGSGRMLRRGYSYRNSPADQGLLFISFQRQLRTFTATQRRLDDGDDLMRFVTATASGSFLILPGFGPGRPLGSGLFAGRR